MLEGLIILLVGALLWALMRPKTWKTPRSTQADDQAMNAYSARQNLFVNAAESSFYAALMRHKRGGYQVFAKVRLEDILHVKPQIKDPKLKWQYRGRIKSRHVDFLVCKQNGDFVCAIELDGSAHKSAEAQMVDDFKDKIFLGAGLELVRAKTGDNFNEFSHKLWARLP